MLNRLLSIKNSGNRENLSIFPKTHARAAILDVIKYIITEYFSFQHGKRYLTSK